MATNPTDRAACLALAQRHVGDVSAWPADVWAAQLEEDAVRRGDPAASYYRPYRTAIAYLHSPERVTQRTEGNVSEQYVDVSGTLSWLRGESEEWDSRLPSDGPDPDDLDLSIRWGSW